jgi:hypothetical protein
LDADGALSLFYENSLPNEATPDSQEDVPPGNFLHVCSIGVSPFPQIQGLFLTDADEIMKNHDPHDPGNT